MPEFLTPADLLCRYLQLPPLPDPPRPVPPGTVCAITGQPITEGYTVIDVTTEATTEFLDCFRDSVNGWVSETAARCFKSANPRTGNPCAKSTLCFADGAGWQPLIAQEAAAEQGRGCWSDLVRQVWAERQGQTCLILLTTDTKKRLWPRARVGILGRRTPVLFHDGATNASAVLLIDWPKLLDCLTEVEGIYTLGFPKEAIRTNLYSATKAMRLAGYAETRHFEQMLRAWRDTPEFTVAALIAQKDELPVLAQPVVETETPKQAPVKRGKEKVAAWQQHSLL